MFKFKKNVNVHEILFYIREYSIGSEENNGTGTVII